MSWIRLSDNYIDHPKFLVLSAQAFRLWHESLAFCRRHQTDGQIAIVELQGFRYYKVGSVKELTMPYKPGAAPLWDTLPGVGYALHDFLIWNLAKDEEQDDRAGATARMRRLRANRKARTIPPGDVTCSKGCDGEQVGERAPLVPVRSGSDRVLRFSERECEGEPSPEDLNKILFRGKRLQIFGWMLHKLRSTLGVHGVGFAWYAWLDEADERAFAELVVADDWWPWVEAELLTYARLQGWAVAVPIAVGKQKPVVAAGQNIIARERAAGR